MGNLGVQLTDDGLALEGGLDYAKEHKIQIAAGTQDTRSYEAPYIYKKDNYYYLFCSTGTCCDGANSTYQTVVSRSENLFGNMHLHNHLHQDIERIIDLIQHMKSIIKILIKYLSCNIW